MSSGIEAEFDCVALLNQDIRSRLMPAIKTIASPESDSNVNLLFFVWLFLFFLLVNMIIVNFVYVVINFGFYFLVILLLVVVSVRKCFWFNMIESYI
jgi:hypothetical protein